ncbi:MAG: Acg family FMN-binding oxidoreductase [Pseudomonadota bacterium]
MTTEKETEQLRSMIDRAVQAPSSHNTQPWYFRLSDSAIELYADRTRALPVNDPDDRELCISCGCALMNLRVAAADRGLGIQTQLLPEPDQADLLARVVVSGPLSAPAMEAQLAESVPRRRTCRKHFMARDVDAGMTEQLVAAAEQEGARLQPLATDVRDRVAGLVAEGDAAQWADPDWRRELAAWMHPRSRGDGLTVPPLAGAMTRLVVRTFNMGGSIGAKDRNLAERSPLLAALSTAADDRRDWLLAGQALQRVLLVACQHGLQASYLNQPIQVASLRLRLRDLLGGGYPQILLRLGYPAEEIPPVPRRPVADVIHQR